MNELLGFEQSMARIEAEKRVHLRMPQCILGLGFALLATFGVCTAFGYSGAGLILELVGLGTMLLISLETLIARVSDWYG